MVHLCSVNNQELVVSVPVASHVDGGLVIMFVKVKLKLCRYLLCIDDGYDKTGNILGIRRMGQTGAQEYGLVDNLALTYSGNQLTKVTDNAASSAYNNGFEFKDGADRETEYTYDENGNLTRDLNRNIKDIQYNFLNLPQRIEFGDGSTTEYLYDAEGRKLRTVHRADGKTTTTDYAGNLIYENGKPVRLITGYGYVSLPDGMYHYYLQDHQGNNRVVADRNGKVEEVNHYYPFGGMFATTGNVQPYKYNGKELDTRKGLNWYDYGARHYDPAVGRWHVQDPMAEKYCSWSLYIYCLNNPANFVDMKGKDVWVENLPNGTYQIVGGTINQDLNIYLVDENENKSNNVVGSTLTPYSFFGDNGKVIKGAIINPQDYSGQRFIDKEIIADNPSILYYMPNAVGGKKYDFKTRGMNNNLNIIEKEQYKYRGMPFKDAQGKIVFASARDIGNYGAGYIAGKFGMDWKTARIGFDGLQSIQEGRLSHEGMTTQKAERLGYEAGTANSWLNQINKWLNQILNRPTEPPF